MARLHNLTSNKKSDIETRYQIRKRIESIFVQDSTSIVVTNTNRFEEISGLISEEDKRGSNLAQEAASTRMPSEVKEESGYSSGPEFEEVELYHFLSSSAFKKMYPLKNPGRVEEISGLSSDEGKRGSNLAQEAASSRMTSPNDVKEESGYSSGSDFEEVELYHFLSSSAFKKMYPLKKTRKGSVICHRQAEEPTSASKSELNNNESGEDDQDFPSSFPEFGITDNEVSQGGLISGIKKFFLIHILYILFISMYYLMFAYCF